MPTNASGVAVQSFDSRPQQANQATKDLARDIERKLDDHEVGKLLMTVDGVGPLTAACLIAELGDPARFHSAAAIAS